MAAGGIGTYPRPRRRHCDGVSVGGSRCIPGMTRDFWLSRGLGGFSFGRVGIKTKRLMAGWNEEYLKKLLQI